MAVALLQLVANGRVVAYEVPRLDEKIKEIEPPGPGLQDVVRRYRGLQSVVQERSQIGVAGLLIKASRSALAWSRRARTSSREPPPNVVLGDPFQCHFHRRGTERRSASSPS